MKVDEYNGKKITTLEVYDGGAVFIGSYVLQILLQFLFVIILVLTGVGQEFTATMVGICIVSALNELSILATPFAYGKIKGNRFVGGAGLKKGISPLQLLTLAGIALATICTFGPLADFFVQFVVWTGYDTSSVTSLNVTGAGELVAALFFMCVVPALCEELLYRGTITRAFSSKGAYFGIFMSALLFALMHGSPIQLVHQFFLGCVCGFVYLWSGSLWASIFVHFINNLVAVVGNYIINITASSFALPWWGSVIMIIVGACLLAILGYVFLRQCAKRKSAACGRDVGLEKVKTARQFDDLTADLYLSEEARALSERESAVLDAELASAANDETREVIVETRRELAKIDGKKNKRALIYAIVVAGAIWVLNTVMGYVQ